jgi:acyl-CoA synthetase
VCLAIIASSRGAVKPLDLLRHLDELGLSKYDMPEFYIELDAFPLTPSGKVLKRRLVELVANGALKPEPVRFAKELSAAP